MWKNRLDDCICPSRVPLECCLIARVGPYMSTPPLPRLLPFASVHEEAYCLGHVVQRPLLLPGLLHIDCDPQGAQTLRSF